MHTGDAFPLKGIPLIDVANGGSAIAFANTIANAAKVTDVETVITGHNTSSLTMADLALFADFNREFADSVRSAKRAAQTIDEFVTSWRIPQRYLDAGYTDPLADDSGQGRARLRLNIEILWRELD